MDKIWRMATVATVATLAVVLTAGAASATTVRASGGHSADSRHHGRNHPVLPKGAFGTVASVNGTSTTGTCGAADTAGTFTVNGVHDTTFTVDVTTTPTATTFAEHGVTTPTFANVCVGDKVGALGMISSDTVTATGVFITPPPTPKPHAVFGTVASVNGTSTTGTCGTADTAGTFTVNGPHDTTFTVDVTTTPTATTFAEHGVTTPTFANVCVGDKVGALGMISSDTVTATGVFITPPPTPKPHAVFGTVASVNGTSTTGTCGTADTAGTFTVNGPHDTTFTVDVTTTPTATTFAEHGVTTPTFANVCVGDKVGALGLVSSDTVTATGVFITTSQTLKPLASFGTPKGSGSQGSKSFSPPAGQPAGNGHGFKSGSTKGWNSSGHSSQHHTH